MTQQLSFAALRFVSLCPDKKDSRLLSGIENLLMSKVAVPTDLESG